MKKIIPALILFSLFISGCQKEISGDIDSNTATNPPASSDVYLPVSKDSYWKYQVTNPGGSITTGTLTSTGQQQTFNGIAYNVFANSPSTAGFENTYMAVKDHKYYSMTKGVSPNTGAPFDLTFLYLNDTASVGYQWNYDAGQGNGFAAKTPGSIVEKNINITVLGKQYTGVIHSRFNLQYVLPGVGTTDYGSYDYYVAKNIGIVKIVFNTSPLFGSIQSVTELMEYSIK